MASAEPTPVGLGARGKRLWQQVVTKYVLTPTGLELLEEACSTADEITTLKRRVRNLQARELVVEGSTGQLKTHPLFDQLLRQRAVFESQIERLNLPNESTLPAPKLVPSRGPYGGTSRAAG